MWPGRECHAASMKKSILNAGQKPPGASLMNPVLISKPEAMQGICIARKRQKSTIVLVPTMGALHTGHRALIREGRKRGDLLVVSIFVNPSQFAPGEDLERYPRTLEADIDMCRKEGVDFIFHPAPETMYPSCYRTYLQVEGLCDKLCGISRPTHFRGVATIVARLFLITQADVAIFGWKDAQQFLILKRMVADLHMPVEMVAVDTIREKSGLALSSRNKYLAPKEKHEASVLYRALQEAKLLHQNDPSLSAQDLRKAVESRIRDESSGRIDYIEIVDMESLEPLRKVVPGNTLLELACYWGNTRLIDNIRL